MAKILGQDKNIKILERAVDLDLPCLLIGETGTGKTSIVRECALQHKQKLIRINLNGQTSVDEFVGKWLVKAGATYWQDGVLLQAMKEGWWLLCDEINACLPEILFALHSLLDDDKFVMVAEKDGEIVRPKKEFRFFATMNPSDEYAGTKELNKAFMSRFPLILDINYLDAMNEALLLNQRTKAQGNELDIEVCKELVGFAHVEVRPMKKREDIFYTLSTRDLLSWSMFYKELGIEESFRVCVLNRAHNGDKQMLIEAFERYFGKKMAIQKQLQVNNLAEAVKQIEDAMNELQSKKAQLDAAQKQLSDSAKKTQQQLEDERAKLEKQIKDFLKEQMKAMKDNKPCDAPATGQKGQTAKPQQSNFQAKKAQAKSMKPQASMANFDVSAEIDSIMKATQAPTTPKPAKIGKSIVEKPEENAGSGTGGGETVIVAKKEKTPDPDTCSHQCDSCSQKVKCYGDVRGVK